MIPTMSVRFTLDQYHRMVRDRLILEGAPIEFVDGILVHKDRSQDGKDPTTVYPPHSAAVQKLSRLDFQLIPFGMHIRTEQPITLPPGSEPEPDGAIVCGPIEAYAYPHPKHIVCAIEVAHGSLDFDRTTKSRLYAAAGIPEYFVINLVERVVESHRLVSSAEGRYEQAKKHSIGATVTFRLNHANALTVPVTDLLP